MHRVILWFRNDLRVHDNPVLHWATKKTANVANKEILPVYCFDPRFFNKTTKYETKKTGILRTKFQLESVNAFREKLEDLGSGLMVSNDRPEDFLEQLINPNWHTTVVYQQETCSQELTVE